MARTRHFSSLRVGAALVAALLLLLPSRPARADRIETLSGALLGDPSWRVKVQAAITLGKLKARDPRAIAALMEALRDQSDAVRAVAAEMLGKLGDRSALDACRTACNDGSPGVRTQAKRAVAMLEKAGASSPASRAPRWYIEFGAVAAASGGAEAARKVHDVTASELERVTGVTLDPAVTGLKSRYWLDANVAELTSGKPDHNGRVQTHCSVRMLLASLPEKSIRVMSTREATVDSTSERRDLEGARSDCLVDTARQIAETVSGYLESHR